MALIGIKKYKHDLTTDLGRAGWEIMTDTLSRRGVHCTVLPADTPRLHSAMLDLYPIDYYRMAPDGSKVYDWVLYGTGHVKRGYVLELGNTPPMPAPPYVPSADVGGLSRTARAVAMVDDGATHQEAADAVGISRAAVTMALSRRRESSGIERPRARGTMAAEWFLEDPYNRTQNMAADKFGVSQPTVNAAVKKLTGYP